MKTDPNFIFEGPCGGGQVSEFKLKDGSPLKLTIMIQENEDNSRLIDMTMKDAVLVSWKYRSEFQVTCGKDQ